MTTTVSSGGYEFNHASVGGKWYWKVVANNVVGAGQLYQVTDIRSPFGPMASSMIPLPGDVVQKMADSLSEMQSLLAPLIALVTPGDTAFAVTVVEDGPTSTGAVTPFLNSGAFGSFLTATATPDVPWLTATPSSVVGVGKNEQAQFTISVLPADLLAVDSPYVGHVNLQDNRATPTTVVITMTVTVQPKPVIALDASEIVLTYSLLTETAGADGVLTVTNDGLASSELTAIIAKVQNASPWLSFTPSSVGPVTSGSATVTFSVVPSGVPAQTGTYTETILVSSSTASNSPQTVSLKLTVSS
jgi:hypothetical protein